MKINWQKWLKLLEEIKVDGKGRNCIEKGKVWLVIKGFGI